MAESQSGFDMDQYTTDLDSGLAGQMPDDWQGHARLAVANSDLGGKQATFAKRLAARLLDKHDGLTADTAAEKAIEKTEEKFSS